MSDSFGRYDVYAVYASIYCYRNTSVLRNRFQIRDNQTLRMIEADISAARQSELLEHPLNGHFSPNHLCRIHQKLLGDVYPFAGHYRREDIAKGSTRFLAHQDIPRKLSHLLQQLQAEKSLMGLDRSELIVRSAYYMAELNYIHPFREGNGRAVREFMRLLYLRNGYLVDWGAVSVDELLQAMIDSVFDAGHLENVLDRCLQSNT